MNTAIYTDAQRAANIGIGFATPINAIRDLLPQLRNGKVTRGVIGVRGRPRSASTRTWPQALGLPEARRRHAVARSSRAVRPTRPGSSAGDVIVEFNGRPVADSDALVGHGRRHQAGHHGAGHDLPRASSARRERHGRRARPRGRAGTRRRAADGEPADEPTATGFGMEVGPITPEVARELELPAQPRRRGRHRRRAQQPGGQRRHPAERRHPRGQPAGSRRT